MPSPRPFTQAIPLEVIQTIDDFAESTALSATCRLYWQALGGKWTARMQVDLKQLQRCPHRYKLHRLALSGNRDFDQQTPQLVAALALQCPSLQHLTFSGQSDNVPEHFVTNEQLALGMAAFHHLRSLHIAGASCSEISFLVPGIQCQNTIEDLWFDVWTAPEHSTHLLAGFLCAAPRLRRLHWGGCLNQSDVDMVFSQTPAFSDAIQHLSLRFYDTFVGETTWDALFVGIGQLVNLRELKLAPLSVGHSIMSLHKAIPSWKLAKLKNFLWNHYDNRTKEVADNAVAAACPLVAQPFPSI